MEHPLMCRSCGHVSGTLGLAYGFDEENWSSWERENMARRREYLERGPYDR